MKILIVYGTTEGQTRKIAEYLQLEIRNMGNDVSVCDATGNPLNPAEFDAILVCSSIHMQKYQSSINDYIRKNKSELNRIHSAFISVSLTAASDDEDNWNELKQLTNEFLQDSGWKPALVEYTAGALRFSEYDFFKKFILRMIAKQNGEVTDGKHDKEFTNWQKLKVFAENFLKKWAPRPQTVCAVESDEQAIG